MPENYLFISYKSEENPFTLKLAASLKNRGVNVWVDRLDGGIETGDLWIEALDNALKGCGGLIAVITPDYFSSKICMNELGYAYREERTLFPVLMRPTTRDLMPFWLPDYQWIDFTGWLDDAAYERQVDALVQHIENKQKRAIGAVPGAEIRYLNTLIAELESQQGVENYIALAGQSEVVRVNPRMEKRVDPSLALLLSEPRPGRDAEPVKREPIADIHEAVNQHPKFVLIGDPGAGKTTTLRRLALETARARLGWINPHPQTPFQLHEEGDKMPEVPLLVYLPRWPDEMSVEEFMGQQWQEQTGLDGDVVRELHEGHIRLYLDGLNEMGSTGIEKTANLRGWLNDKTSPPKYAAITCRKDDYSDDLDLKLPTILVEPLNDEKIREFAEKYLEDKENVSAFCEKVFLVQKVSSWESLEKRSLVHLARNPYLLAALLLIFETGGDLPRNTGALFQKLVMALWERERLRKTQGWLPLNQMQKAFGQLAFDMINTDQPIDVPLAYTLEKLGGGELLNAGKSAGFVIVNGEQVRFRHQLMLEFFCAFGLLRQGIDKSISKPVFSLLWRDSTKWDEVIVTLCGIVNDPDPIVLELNHIDPYLAADCLMSGIIVNPTTRGAVVNTLLDLFEDEKWTVRGEVAKALGIIGDTSVVPKLMSALQDEEPLVRPIAAEALGRIGDVTALPSLVNALQDELPTVRIAALQALGQIGDVTILPSLLNALEHGLPPSHISALEALARIGDVTALPRLLNALQDELSSVHTPVHISALEPLEQQATLSELLDALRSKDSSLRSKAANALGKIGHSDAVPSLIKRLVDTEQSRFSWGERVCDIVADALEEIGTPEALSAVQEWRENPTPFFVRGLRDTDPIVRCCVAKELGDIRDTNTVPELLNALRDEDLYVRHTVVEALGKIGDISIIPELLNALQDETLELRGIITTVLSKVCDTSTIPLLIERLTEGMKLGRIFDLVGSSITVVLEEIGTPEALEAVQLWDEYRASFLLKELINSDPKVRRNAAKLLGSIGNGSIVSELVNALGDEDIHVRRAVVAALGRIGNVSAVPGLIDALKDEDPNLQVAIVWALSEVCDVSAVPILIERLTDRMKSGKIIDIVCSSIVVVLEKIGTPEALEAVWKWRREQKE